MFLDLEQNPDQSQFNIVCQSANDYSGPNYCAYNLANAFAQAYQYLDGTLSKRSEDWAWKNVHVNAYNNMPWSKIPILKSIFHREIPASGNTQTPDTSRFFFRQMEADMKFKALYTANYK